MNPNQTIADRGRGPELAGTRITVYDILDGLLEGWPPARIATFFRLSSRQVEAAVTYIQEHKSAVITRYAQMLERAERGNPPEVQARLKANRAAFRERVKELRRTEAREAADVGNRGGQ